MSDYLERVKYFEDRYAAYLDGETVTVTKRGEKISLNDRLSEDRALREYLATLNNHQLVALLDRTTYFRHQVFEVLRDRYPALDRFNRVIVFDGHSVDAGQLQKFWRSTGSRFSILYVDEDINCDVDERVDFIAHVSYDKRFNASVWLDGGANVSEVCSDSLEQLLTLIRTSWSAEYRRFKDSGVESEESEVRQQVDLPPAIWFSVDQMADPLGVLVNSIGMKFVPIPAGGFLMGGRDGEIGYDATEEAAHFVRITQSYLLGMFPVTQSEYSTITGENPSVFHGKSLPVEHVTWHDAMRFCELLSAWPGERTAGRTYRLPTEAEWEYACRSGSKSAYSCGDTLEHDQARFCDDRVIVPQPTSAVGSYPPNTWHLFDMHGNVWEWVHDWFQADYYAGSSPEDPPGPGRGSHHVLRGGSASVLAHECRSAMRGEAKSDGPNDFGSGRFEVIGDFGFRIVCEVRTKA